MKTVENLEELEQAYSNDALLVVFDRLDDVEIQQALLMKRIEKLEKAISRNRHSWFVAAALGLVSFGAFFQIEAFSLSQSGIEIKGAGRDFQNVVSLICAISAIPLLGEDYLKKLLASKLGLPSGEEGE